jgi:hypothetical protein
MDGRIQARAKAPPAPSFTSTPRGALQLDGAHAVGRHKRSALPCASARPAVNQPDDQYEHETDSVTEPGSFSLSSVSIVRRQGAGEAPSTIAPPIVHDVLRSLAHSLDAATRAFMEPRFGLDFSRVRVHTGARAAESAQAVDARAYTVGQDIVFGAGQYAPATLAGRQLLAHELAHVVQQGLAPVPSSLLIDSQISAAEREAEQTTIRLAGATKVERLPALNLQCANRISVARQIIRESPYKPSTTVPDLDEEAVNKAEAAIRSGKFQEAIDILIAEAASVNRVNRDLLENKTMAYDPQLNQEGLTTDPLHDRSGGMLPTKVRIGPPAFKFGVSWLYSTILHEFIHVQQGQPISAGMPVTVKDVSSDPGQSNAKEVEAYAFEITHAAATGIKSSPKLIAEIWSRLCHAYAYMMPIRKRTVEAIARKAFDIAKSIVGADKINDCLQ